MLDIMTPLISEADSVSQDLLDVVLGCILEPFKVHMITILKPIFMPPLPGGIVFCVVRLWLRPGMHPVWQTSGWNFTKLQVYCRWEMNWLVFEGQRDQGPGPFKVSHLSELLWQASNCHLGFNLAVLGQVYRIKWLTRFVDYIFFVINGWQIGCIQQYTNTTSACLFENMYMLEVSSLLKSIVSLWKCCFNFDLISPLLSLLCVNSSMWVLSFMMYAEWPSSIGHIMFH